MAQLVTRVNNVIILDTDGDYYGVAGETITIMAIHMMTGATQARDVGLYDANLPAFTHTGRFARIHMDAEASHTIHFPSGARMGGIGILQHDATFKMYVYLK